MQTCYSADKVVSLVSVEGGIANICSFANQTGNVIQTQCPRQPLGSNAPSYKCDDGCFAGDGKQKGCVVSICKTRMRGKEESSYFALQPTLFCVEGVAFSKYDFSAKLNISANAKLGFRDVCFRTYANPNTGTLSYKSQLQGALGPRGIFISLGKNMYKIS